MAKFLTTTGISYNLEEIIKNAKKQLVLISPFLKINERLKALLEDQNRMKIDIRVVYGKSELQPNEIAWLRDMQSIRTSFCQNLHAKCYLNEEQALITSMNLYEFSQVNNEEMGIMVSAAEDSVLYREVSNEAQHLIRKAEEVRLTAERVPREAPVKSAPAAAKPSAASAKNAVEKTNSTAKPSSDAVSSAAFCIRCAVPIPLNVERPYCASCFKSWSRYKNEEYEEKHCHNCGKTFATSMAKPVCRDCYRASR